MNGFGNEFESEAPGFEGKALPRDLINPQCHALGLFAEQLSGTAFTAPRASNRRSWLYRVKPSVCHKPFERVRRRTGLIYTDARRADPNQRRWRPFEVHPMGPGTSFVDGINTLAFSDESGCAQSSVSIHIYLMNKSMGTETSFVNSDGDFLLVPQLQTIEITTEFGVLVVEPGEIAVIQQGMKFSVDIQHESQLARGYILEARGNHFELPYLGPIGANCLANPRDFWTPAAQISPLKGDVDEHKCVMKFQNELFETVQPNSPYDVAGWFGNYVPYKYNLNKFVTVNSVSVDHPDPSIFTVLTCPSTGKPGTALADFVIFPPRWECAGNTFRPPYYHRNCMTEFMGLIKGRYQAKGDKFAPGGGSLHHCMVPHGPDKECYDTASKQDTSVPKRVADGTMAFMFETSMTLKISEWALTDNVDEDYHKCWSGL